MNDFSPCQVCIRILQICHFICHLTAAVSHPVAGRIAIAAEDLPCCLENSAEPLQALDRWGLRGPCTAIFTLVAELPILLPAGFAVCLSWP